MRIIHGDLSGPCSVSGDYYHEMGVHTGDFSSLRPRPGLTQNGRTNLVWGIWLVGGLEHEFSFPIYWESSSQVTFIFFRGVKPPTRFSWGFRTITNGDGTCGLFSSTHRSRRLEDYVIVRVELLPGVIGKHRNMKNPKKNKADPFFSSYFWYTNYLNMLCTHDVPMVVVFGSVGQQWLVIVNLGRTTRDFFARSARTCARDRGMAR